MSGAENCVVEEHLNENVRGLTPSATVVIDDRSNELRRNGGDIFKLGFGQSPFPVPDVVVEALREHAGAKDYLPVWGLESGFRRQASGFRERPGARCPRSPNRRSDDSARPTFG